MLETISPDDAHVPINGRKGGYASEGRQKVERIRLVTLLSRLFKCENTGWIQSVVAMLNHNSDGAISHVSVASEDGPALWWALERCIEIAGEAANLPSDETRAAYPSLEWRGLIGVRVLVAHAYHRTVEKGSKGQPLRRKRTKSSKCQRCVFAVGWVW